MAAKNDYQPFGDKLQDWNKPPNWTPGDEKMFCVGCATGLRAGEEKNYSPKGAGPLCVDCLDEFIDHEKQQAFAASITEGYASTRMFRTLAPIAAQDEMERMAKDEHIA